MNCCFMLKRCLLKFVSWCWKSSRMFCKSSLSSFHCDLNRHFLFFTFLVLLSDNSLSCPLCEENTCLHVPLTCNWEVFIFCRRGIHCTYNPLSLSHSILTAISSKSVPPNESERMQLLYKNTKILVYLAKA